MKSDSGGRQRALRERAEAMLSRSRRERRDLSPAEVESIIHDLSVYQIELELQNEELRDVQAQLGRARDRFARLYHQAPVGYLTLDSNGLIEQTNQTFADMVGRQGAELVGRALVEFMIAADQSIFRGRFKPFFADPNGKSVDVTLQGSGFRSLTVRLAGRRANRGAPFQANAGHPVLLVAASDITERKRAEEELQRLSLVAAHSTNAIFITDAERRIEWVNRAFTRLSGFAAAELQGRHLRDVLRGAETDPATLAAIEHAMETGCGYEGEILSDHREGSAYWTQLLLDPVRDEAGRLIRFIGVQTDITARRQARLALQEKNAELERFIYLISHDFKSPLVTIKAFLGYLERDLIRSDTAQIAQDMVYIHAAADRMSQLLEELLELPRIGRIERPPVRVDFQDLVEEALRLTAGGITERGVAVRSDRAAVTLVGDGARLLEIWQNLIENAVKYMGEQSAPHLEIGVERRGWELVFYVRDNGMGIEPRYQEQVFGLFEKLDPQSEGTGLGLALVKRIVESYRGHIWLESAGRGQGTCVRFTLPEAVEERCETQE